MTTYLTPTTTAEYTYNTKGLRISKTVNGQETRHIWDGSNIVMELNGSDQVIDKYIRGNQLIKSDLNGYYLYNNHGDVIQLTDKQGTVTTSYLYDAFGIEQEPQPNDPNPFRYCGEYLDKESGNVYLRARYYDPETGRFISEDPIRDGLNWYVYCNNDPVNYFDPRGLAIGDVTMPNGDVIHGTITDGITHLPDGSRPPEGAVVETAAGFYMMSNGSGVEVTPTSVTTSNGSNVTGYNAGGTTYMLGGSRPTVGSTVHTSGGDYLMTASGGVLDSGGSSSAKSSSYTSSKGIYDTAPVEWYMNQDTGVQFVTGLVAGAVSGIVVAGAIVIGVEYLAGAAAYKTAAAIDTAVAYTATKIKPYSGKAAEKVIEVYEGAKKYINTPRKPVSRGTIVKNVIKNIRSLFDKDK